MYTIERCEQILKNMTKFSSNNRNPITIMILLIFILRQNPKINSIESEYVHLANSLIWTDLTLLKNTWYHIIDIIKKYQHTMTIYEINSCKLILSRKSRKSRNLK